MVGANEYTERTSTRALRAHDPREPESPQGQRSGLRFLPVLLSRMHCL
jgi:hypothetical protein